MIISVASLSVLFGRHPGPVVPAILPTLMGAVIITELISAALLLGQFFETRSPALLLPGLAYLYSGVLVIPYLLTFPNVYSATGLFNANDQTALALWILWHAGFPALLCAYVFVDRVTCGTTLSKRRTRELLFASVCAVVGFAFFAAVITTRFAGSLPMLLEHGKFSSLTLYDALPAIVVLDVAALGLLVTLCGWRRVTDVWLSLAVLASLFDSVMGLVCARYSYGWYVGKAFSVVASTLILCAFLTEITLLYRRIAAANKDLRRLRDEAMEVSLVKSQFLANMSHEIRTPMNGIVGTTELLLRSDLSGEQREFAGIIRESGNALLTIINQILDLSKLEVGRVELEIDSFSPLTLAEGAVELLKIQASEKKLSLQTFVSSDVPRMLRGDSGRLRQILLNLVGNAIKFTQRGGVSLRVSVDAADSDHVVLRFAVADTGSGLPASVRDRLFQPFTQADGSTTRKFGGTGLGLSICKRLVELMGGTIGVDCESDSGSTFWFTSKFECIPTRDGAESNHQLRGLHALVIESNATALDVIGQYVRSWGMRTTGFGEGVDALLQLRRQAAGGDPYDIAIIDSATLETEVASLALAVKSDPALRGTKLILITDFESRAAGKEALAAGFASYLAKPVRQSQLLDCIATAMNGSTSGTSGGDRRSIEPALVPTNGLAHPSTTSILLAEDNATNRRLALAQLNELGLKADVVSNGREAIDAFAKNRYAVVLMDCQMPEVDGFEATRAIREMELRGGEHARIIAMTANAMEGDRKICVGAGMDDYISKPVQLEVLREALTPWVRKAIGHMTGAGNGQPVLDAARLQHVFRNDPMAMRELLDVFIVESRKLATELETAIASRDAAAAAAIAHQLRGSSANVGGDELSHLSLTIELAVREGNWGGAQHERATLYEALERFELAAAKVPSVHDSGRPV